jgi:hypothetical protein
MPRSRTAWLGALLATPKVPVYHDILTYPPEGELYAISDPTVAVMEPAHTIADGVPTVVVVRDAQASATALARAFDVAVDKPFLDRMTKAFYAFCTKSRPAMYVRYDALEHDEAIQAISLYLTDKEVDERRLATFRALHITEDVPRARTKLAAHPQLGLVH